MRYILNKSIILIFTLFINISAKAIETCSRVAVINYQEVLVDTNSTQKGEGLRFHLEKDKVAKSLLDQYQEGTEVNWQNAALGTIGSGLVLSSAFTNSTGNNKRSLVIGGLTLILINFLVAKTLDHNNEKNLTKAIEEYNKRNLPRIYFNQSSRSNSNVNIVIAKSWSF